MATKYHVGAYRHGRLADMSYNAATLTATRERCTARAEDVNTVIAEMLRASVLDLDDSDREPPIHLLDQYQYAPVACIGKRRCNACYESRIYA